MDEPSSTTEKEHEDEARLRNALSDLVYAAVTCASMAFAIRLVLSLIIFESVALPGLIGSTIGSLIFPAIFSLVFKNKARAFVVIWVIFMALSLTGWLYDVRSSPRF